MMAGSFAELAAICARIAIALPKSRHEALDEATKLVQKSVKESIGTYDGNQWPPLSPSTQEDRVRQGYAADEPLLRSGEFRDSIERTVEGDEGHVGTNDKRGRFFEFGTPGMPPRPVLMPAVFREKEEIEKLVKRKITAELRWRR